MKSVNSTRYTDSQKLRDALSLFGLMWGLNKAVKIQGLIDVLITMFLAGEISSDRVKERYMARHNKIVKEDTKRLLKNRYNK